VWFIIGLLFISQIVTLDATVADRWFYFPIVGILGMIGYVVNFYKHKDGVSRMTTILLIGSIVVLSIRTMERNTNWVNAMTLYTHDIKIHDNNELETNLGEEYNKKGMYNEALLHFNKAALLLPTSGAYYNIGIVNEEMGNKSKAIEAYTKALNVTEYEPKEQKRSPFIYIRLAQLLIKESKNIQAKDVIYKGLADYPSSPYLWIELTIAEYNLQNNAKALEAAENAMKLMPNDQTKALYIQLLNNQPLNVSLSL
jgi:tetratricopeptide (TPR) repeat protein